MRATFDARLIAELRSRVIAHNTAHPHAKAKLGDLRKAYERGYRRSNPSLRALERVDAHLDRLAKGDDAFDEDKHPRADDGEFSAGASAAVAIPLPATPAAHRALQGSNSGYKALTTEVIPERRNEAAGSIIRDVGSLGAGAGVVSALARNKPGSLAERVAGGLAGSVGRMSSGAAASAAGQAAHHLSRTVHRMTGLGPVVSARSAERFRQTTAEGGRMVGHAAGVRAVRLTGALVRGALKTAGNGNLHPRAQARFKGDVHTALGRGVPLSRAVMQAQGNAFRLDRRLKSGRQALVYGVLAGATGLGIRHQLQDSIVDPAGIGRNIDAFQFRSVQKAAAASDELGAMRLQLTGALAKAGPAGGSMGSLSGWVTAGGGALGDLRKGPQPWGWAARRLFSGAAAVGGAAVGGGLGFAASRATRNGSHGTGHFEEDLHPRAKDGKFTDGAHRDHRFAQVGGILGGAAAGIAVYMALKRHNERIPALNVARIRQKIAALRSTTAADAGGQLGRAVKNTAKSVTAHLETGPAFKEHRAEIESIARLGPSDPSVMQGRLKRAYHERIAETLATENALQIPDGKTWKKIGDVAMRSGGTVNQIAYTKQRVVEAMATMTTDDFGRAVANLPAAVADRAKAEFARAELGVAEVPDLMRGHGARVEVAKEAQAAAGTELDRAAKHRAAVLTDLNMTADGPEKDAKQALVASAEEDLKTAMASHKKLSDKAEKLANNPTGVADPYSCSGAQ